ncbi:MAG: hypothetical protein ACK6DC_10390 [Planctomycetota bacterium]|jgi:hypothetical protein
MTVDLEPPSPKQSSAERDRLARSWEWRYWWIANVACAVLVVGCHLLVGVYDGIPASLVALGLCSSTAAGPILWRRGSFGSKMPVASILMSIALRMLLMVGAMGLVIGSKWPHAGSFAGTLLGCYLIFLVLESALSIRYYSSRTPV